MNKSQASLEAPDKPAGGEVLNFQDCDWGTSRDEAPSPDSDEAVARYTDALLARFADERRSPQG